MNLSLFYNVHRLRRLKVFSLAILCFQIVWESLPVLVSQFNLLKEFNKEECLKMMVDSLSTKLEDLSKDTLPVHGVGLI